MDPSTRTKVYFIENVDTGRIKVGFTTATVWSRLQAFQTGTDCELRILGVLYADQELGTMEWQLHQKFRKHHHRGEWYTREILPTVLELLHQEARRRGLA
jgi:hypothetical protein